MSGHGDHLAGGMRWSLSTPFLAVTWEPEGLLLTPRTESAPYGYGFPKRHSVTGARINPPFGTKIVDEHKEACNQVLINRFPNNKYLDRRQYIEGLDEAIKFRLPEDNVRLRQDASIPFSKKPTIIYWPLFYAPAEVGDTFWQSAQNRLQWVDEPGVNSWLSGMRFVPHKKPKLDEDGKIIDPIPERQFSLAKQSLLYEAETGTWYCHWPEELLYDNAAAEAIFLRTNQYRAEVGRDPIYRAIRGYGDLATMIATEVQRSGIQGHNEDVFRSGHQLFADRIYNTGVYATTFYVGENLTTLSYTHSAIEEGVLSFPAGEAAALTWRNSPPHYKNMINDYWETNKTATSLQIASGVSVTLTLYHVMDINFNLVGKVAIDPPFSGSHYVQVFNNSPVWLSAGGVTQHGKYGTTTLFHFTSPIGPGKFTNDDIIPGAEIRQNSTFYYKGRAIYNNQVNSDGQSLHMLLGVVAGEQDGVPIFRQVWYLHNMSTGVRKLQCFVRPISANHSEWVLENEDESILENMAFNIGMFLEIPFILTKFSFNSIGNHGVITVVKNKLTARPTYFWPAQEEATRINVVHSIIQYIPGGGFSELSEVVGPDITYTFTPGANNQPPHTYTQVGSGYISSFPQYNESDQLVYLKLHYDVDIQNGPDKISGHYVVKEWIEFASTNTFVIKDIDIYWATNDIQQDDGVVEAGSFCSFLLYLDSIHEDVVYYKIDLSVMSWEDWYQKLQGGSGQQAILTNALNGMVSLWYNGIKLKEAVDTDFPLQHLWGVTHVYRSYFAPMTPFVEVLGSPFEANGANSFYVTESSYYNLRHAVLPYPYGYVDGAIIARQFNPVVSAGFTAVYGRDENINPFIYSGKLLNGTMPVCLGLKTASRELLSCASNAMQSGYNLALPMVNRHDRVFIDSYKDNNYERVHCWFARYKDRVILQVDWDFAAQGSNGNIWKAVWLNGDDGYRTIYANFSLDDEVGIGELKNIVPLGVIR